MTLTLYFHPLCSYCWKALVALYGGAPFTPRQVSLGHAEDRAALQALQALWPPCRFPVLHDGAADSHP